MDHKKLELLKTYSDKDLGRILFIGVQGKHLAYPNMRKGYHLFVVQSTLTVIWLTKKDILMINPS